MHDIIGFGMVMAAILAGILLNRSDSRELRDKLDAFKTEVHGEFERFYMTLGQHDAKIESLEKK